MALNIQVPALDRDKNVAELNRLMRSHPSPSDNKYYKPILQMYTLLYFKIFYILDITHTN
jgi:hypothetical protein